jgi:hypothetical protein
MTSILGIDLSSTQLDACLLVDDQPPVLRRETLGKATEPLIERLRSVPLAVAKLAFLWRVGDVVGCPDWVVLEQPAGRYGLHALLPILGAITASVPAESQIGWRKASEWRSDLGVRNSKAAGHHEVKELLCRGWRSVEWWEFDEHQLDAAGIALAWQRILASNEAAA